LILQSSQQYFARTAGGATVYPEANMSVYRNTDGTGAETTSSSYTWFAGSTMIESTTVSKPIVSTAQNGPGTADQSTTFNDVYARPIWHKDGDGFIHYTEYDQATGAVSKTIVDVDTTRTSDFTNLPAGWSTPAGGGLHLINLDEVDGLGRTTKYTDPLGNITYTVYKDTNYEVRTYPGWNTATNLPTGPTQVSRYDRPGSYSESLTMTATPAVDAGGRPTGAEAISSLQTLSRSYTNNSGQVTHSDEYFNLSGVTYSTAANLGTENTNYYRTRFAYDDRGLQERVQLPTGTIERTVYDNLRRAKSSWIGTNDTGATHDDPTGGGAPGNNMIKISENVYDSGGIGDGNLTQVTAFPGTGANRVTQMFYDWRNRQVASKAGVEASESTSLNRPIYYVELDNLSQTIANEQYDGDGVTITDGNNDGVPDKPSSSLLRARGTADFDD